MQNRSQENQETEANSLEINWNQTNAYVVIPISGKKKVPAYVYGIHYAKIFNFKVYTSNEHFWMPLMIFKINFQKFRTTVE